MAKTNYKSIDEYHQAFPAPVRERMQTIRQLIQQVAPQAAETISYQIPAFKIGKFYLIYYSAYEKHISLSSPWSQSLLTAFAGDLKTLKVSKAAIQLPNNQPLPMDFIQRLIQFRKLETEANQP